MGSSGLPSGERSADDARGATWFEDEETEAAQEGSGRGRSHTVVGAAAAGGASTNAEESCRRARATTRAVAVLAATAHPAR